MTAEEVQVIGPPGCGKTTELEALIMRAADRYGADRLMAASFTVTAATNLNRNHLPIPQSRIGTLHAIAYRALLQAGVVAADIADTDDGLKEWNQQCRDSGWTRWTIKADDDTRSRDSAEPGWDTRSTESSDGDAVFAEYQLLRARMVTVDLWPGRVLEFAELWEDWKRQTGKIDFTDMISLAIQHVPQLPGGIKVGFFDECLPFHTPVMLADGSSMQIGEIVRLGLKVQVLAYNTETGQQEACNVVGWHHIPNQKRLVKISTHTVGRKYGGNYLQNFIVCTEDHKVWADGRWVPAGEVTPGMEMQAETAAQRSQKYKITTGGRLVLAGVMAGKNATLERQPHPSVITEATRGGNGRTVPLPQRLLYEALGSGWELEHVVSLKGKRSPGMPKHYKIDIANPGLKVAVEVDGQSHHGATARERDSRKDAFLRDEGWKVLRVTNRDAVQRTTAIAAAILEEDCPVPTTVVAVEEIAIPDQYVYDITVERLHNFYANGLLVHNCQDFTALEQHLVRTWGSHMDSYVMAGDEDQCIFPWKGADYRVFIDHPTKYKRFLTQSYRVPGRVHAWAEHWIGQVERRTQREYHPRKDEAGQVVTGSVREVNQTIYDGDSLAAFADRCTQAGKSVMFIAACGYHLGAIKGALREAGLPFHNPYRIDDRQGWNPLRSLKHGVSSIERVLALLRPDDATFGQQSRWWTNEDVLLWLDPLAADGAILPHQTKKGTMAALKAAPAAAPVTWDFLLAYLTEEAVERLVGQDLEWYRSHVTGSKSDVLRYPLRVAEKRGGIALRQRPMITLGTIHSVKGGEADVVVVAPDLSPAGYGEWEGGNEPRENVRRLFFVAATRAKQDLILLRPSSKLAVNWR